MHESPLPGAPSAFSVVRGSSSGGDTVRKCLCIWRGIHLLSLVGGPRPCWYGLFTLACTPTCRALSRMDDSQLQVKRHRLVRMCGSTCGSARISRPGMPVRKDEMQGMVTSPALHTSQGDRSLLADVSGKLLEPHIASPAAQVNQHPSRTSEG